MEKSGIITKKEIFILSVFLYFRWGSNALCSLSNNGTSSSLFTVWSFSKLRCMRSLFENMSDLSSSRQGFCSNIFMTTAKLSIYLTEIFSYPFLITIFSQHDIRFFLVCNGRNYISRNLFQMFISLPMCNLSSSLH